jgi:membrane-bound serine protease (ClpP class)
MSTALLIGILLQVLGVVVILAEFVIPSAGMLTIIALALFGYSLYSVYSGVSIGAAVVLAAFDVALIPFAIWVGVKIVARSPMALHSTLTQDTRDDPAAPPLPQVGDVGVVMHLLRPAGSARFNGRKFDVVSTGDYIEPDRKVRIVSIQGNRITVIPHIKE